MRPASSIIALLTLSASMAAAYPASSPHAQAELFGGTLVSMPLSWSLEDPVLPHFGWGLDFGADLRLKSIIAARLDIGFLFIGQSAVSPLGMLYRAWDGLRFSLSAGYSFELGSLSLDILAGGGLTAARYHGTSLVFAYPSLIARAELLFPLGPRGILKIGLPFEFMLRADGQTLSPGLSLSYAYGFPIGGQS